MNGSHVAFPSVRHPRIYFPVIGSARTRKRVIATLPDNSLKRRIYRLAVLILSPFFSTNLIKRMKINLPIRAKLLLDYLYASGSIPADGLSVAFPSMVLGRNRLYLRHYSSDGELVAFSKIGFGKDDPSCFAREHEALIRFRGHSIISVPEVIAYGEMFGVGNFLVTRSLSTNFGTSPFRGEEVLERLGVVFDGMHEPLVRSKLTSAWWYQLALTRLNAKTSAFVENILGQTLTITVAPAHGDIGGENVFASKDGSLAILDWENFDIRAPLLTDKISRWIGLHHKLVKRFPSSAFAAFTAAFPGPKVDVVLALVFQVGVGLIEAEMLLDRLVIKADL